MTDWKTSACRGCGAPMIWTVTSRGKNMPLDAEETSRAAAGPKAILWEIQESETGKGNPLAVVTHAEEGHVSHWGTCPKREDFRR